MADVKIEDRSFVNDSGNVVNYKRLVIRGVLQGEVQAVELGIDKNQATLVNMLLKSDEKEVKSTTSHQPYVSRTANERLVDEAEKALKEEEEENTKSIEDFQSGFNL